MVASPNREAWLAARRRCITASHVAPVLEVDSPVGTDFDTWSWIVHGIGAEETPAMRRGRLLQSGLLAYAAEELGEAVDPWPDWHLAGGAPDIWGATPDGVATTGLVECKTSAWGRWGTSPPLHVLIQLQVQLHCTGEPRGWIAADVRGELRLWGPYDYGPRFCAAARRRCQEWWDRHVVGGEMPAIDGRPSTSRALSRIGEPQIQDRAVRLPASADACAVNLKCAREAGRAARDVGGTAGNSLRALLGWYAYGVTPGGRVVSHRDGQIRLLDKLPRGVRAPSPWRSE